MIMNIGSAMSVLMIFLKEEGHRIFKVLLLEEKMQIVHTQVYIPKSSDFALYSL